MSASERLREMDAAIRECARVVATEKDGVYAEPLPDCVLVEAWKAQTTALPAVLPLLADVVEAAELVERTNGGDGARAWPEIATALAALRAHLESTQAGAEDPAKPSNRGSS